ncbi:Protein of unknown function [Marininema mesophilum]|uniref:4 TMS phage holin, superfamily IV n=1 Tax=Marininema mesophilum TaxID=1048340 RepID=A0A1H2W624_9BACL|nr:DUF2512 family protein [Marininema mesophilum]SDW75981.1 Protein of unknown function [Marininema mesophilum]
MNWLLKIVMYSTVIFAITKLTGTLSYYSVWVPAVIVLFFATVGHYADEWILPRLGNIRSALLGGLFMAVVTYGAQAILPGFVVSGWGALMVGVFLGIVEYRMHIDLLKYRPPY